MNCYLLAGGLGRRMGRSKVDLPFAGSTFGERVLDAARGAFDDVKTIVDRPEDGPAALFGVAAALADAKERCFILAVDYPLITSELLRFLRGRFEVAYLPLLVPEWDGHPQPLCGGYDPALLPLVERRLGNGQFELRGLIAEAGAEIIPERELRARFTGEPLLNVNTPDELRKAEELHGRS
jgi:molybdopterin-guanine dinucleotide biosynthesis protein A